MGVVNTGHVVNHVVNSERSESTLRGVRGAPGAHSRRVTTDRPPTHGDDAHPAPNKLHRDPACYSTPPRSTSAGPKTPSPPRNDPNSGAARLKCTVSYDPQRPVIPGLWRGPGNGVACSGEYANAGSNGRFGLDWGEPVRCPSKKLIAAISAKPLSENHAVAYLHRFLVDSGSR